MASLLKLTDTYAPGGDSRERDPAEGMRGKLDPLTLATYRWRIVSGMYDRDAVLQVIAERLTIELM